MMRVILNSPKRLKQLLEQKKTDLITGFVTVKEGKEKTFHAHLVLDETCNLSFKFPSDDTTIKCPKCKTKLLKKRGSNIFCTSCDFRFFTTVAGKMLDTNTIKIVLEGKTSPKISGFISKKKKKFSARLKLNQEFNLSFLFAKK